MDDRRWCEAAQRDFQRVKERERGLATVAAPHALSPLQLATSFFIHNVELLWMKKRRTTIDELSAV